MTDRRTYRRATLLSAVLAGAVALPAGAQAAVNIPEGGAITPASVHIINMLVTDGCEDALPMDEIEVTLPPSVTNPVPESIAGWDAEILMSDDEDDPRTIVRWSGGPLEDGELLEFGLRLGFPDEPDAVLEFPVTQRCGLVEQTWVGSDGPTPAPTVTLRKRFGARDVLELAATVSDLQGRIDELETRLGGVDPENLRSRVADNEAAIGSLADRLDEVEARMDGLEPEAEG